MSKIINKSILKRVNEDLDYFSKEVLRDYLNQMQGQVLHIADKRDECSFQADYWMNESTKLHKRISNFYKRNIFQRIKLAIERDIH